MRLQGKVALITGSTRGIGRGIAEAFAREGARLIVHGRSPDRVEQIIAALRAAGAEVDGLTADIGVPEEAIRLVDQAARSFGRLDILVNNAGIWQRRPVLEITLDEWQRMLAVNLTGAFLCAQAAARIMVRQGDGGTIINISSDGAWTGGMNPCAHYCVTKAGMLSFNRSMAKELAPYGIRVNGIAPGIIESDMGSEATAQLTGYHIPLNRLGTPGDVASVAVFLASDESSYMTGTTINLTGGLWLDR
jgi:3-oxoacyl-[acyl-carrier protein] reductase